MSTPSPSQGNRVLAQVAGSLSSLLLLSIVLMVNYLAFRHYMRFDWTSQGMYTLSPKSLEVIRGLDKDVDFYVFMSRGEGSFEETNELLKRYQAASPHVLVHNVDPDRDAAQFKLLAQRFGIAAGVIETGEARADVAAVVALGDKSWHVDRDDLVSFDFGGAPGDTGDQEVSMKAEQALTGAVVQVTSGRPTKVCVTQGHGEWSLDDGQERSLSTLKEGLKHDNLQWEGFETLGKTQVPEGCDAVMVFGPVRAFSAGEAKLLFDYLKAGGNLLLALDPMIELDQVSATGLEDGLRDLGIRLDRALVLELDKDHLLTPNAAEFIVTEFGDHPTTRPLQHSARVFMSLVRGVSVAGDNPDIDILLRTTEQAFGKTNIAEVKDGADMQRGAADIAGPVSLALGLQVGAPEDGSEKAGGRLIVVGDSDFLQGPLLQSPELANFHMASAFIGHVAERSALIAIPPKKVKTGNIVFTQEDLWALFFRVAVLVPAAAFVLGFAVWLNRRA
jgi:ABC-2 type transport system permease protein